MMRSELKGIIDGMKSEISRLQEQNQKLREALINERANNYRLQVRAGYCFETEYAEGRAERQLRAEGLIE
jgi:hypothetical protein